MASVVVRRACAGVILRSLKCSQINRFNFEIIPGPHLKYVQCSRLIFGKSYFCNQAEAPKEAENLKTEKDIKEDGKSFKEKELAEENEKLTERLKELDDKYKRSIANNENTLQRMRREINDARQYGIHGFVKDLVEVADVLGKATESVPKEALDSGNPHLKSLFEGLQMTEAQLLKVFKRHGVVQINPIGEKFNPNQHEALFEQEHPTLEPGTVGTVTKVGYMLHERVVRPAMVGVVKK